MSDLLRGDVDVLREQVAALEREVADLREIIGQLQGDLRGAGEWMAEHSDWINEQRQLQAAARLPERDDLPCPVRGCQLDHEFADHYRAAEIQGDDR